MGDATERSNGWVPRGVPPRLPPVAASARVRDRLAQALPSTLRYGRLAVTVPAVLGVAAVVLLAVGIAIGSLVLRGGSASGEVAPPRRLPSSTAQSATSTLRPTGTTPSAVGAPGMTPGSASSSAAPMLRVDVVGKVRRSGVVRLPGGSRVEDAVAAAGGPAPGARLDAVNLARPLADGEQIVVPAAGEPVGPLPAQPRQGGGGSSAGGSSTPGTSPAPGSPVDLNTATAEQLDGLPGVGPVLAQRIVEWRQRNGRFGSVDDLRDVSGIGAKKFADLAPLVRV